MRRLLGCFVLVVVLGGVSCLPARGASAVKDPLKLVPAAVDFPAGVRVNTHVMPPDAVNVLGVKGLKAVDFSASIPAGGVVHIPDLGDTDKEWFLDGEVYVAPNLAGAKQLFNLGKRAGIGFFSDASEKSKPVKLPSYGEEQIAFGFSTKGATFAAVFVRKGSVVWEMRAASVPAQWQTTVAQAATALQTYAAKEQKRIGDG